MHRRPWPTGSPDRPLSRSLQVPLPRPRPAGSPAGPHYPPSRCPVHGPWPASAMVAIAVAFSGPASALSGVAVPPLSGITAAAAWTAEPAGSPFGPLCQIALLPVLPRPWRRRRLLGPLSRSLVWAITGVPVAGSGRRPRTPGEEGTPIEAARRLHDCLLPRRGRNDRRFPRAQALGWRGHHRRRRRHLRRRILPQRLNCDARGALIGVARRFSAATDLPLLRCRLHRGAQMRLPSTWPLPRGERRRVPRSADLPVCRTSARRPRAGRRCASRAGASVRRTRLRYRLPCRLGGGRARLAPDRPSSRRPGRDAAHARLNRGAGPFQPFRHPGVGAHRRRGRRAALLGWPRATRRHHGRRPRSRRIRPMKTNATIGRVRRRIAGGD